MAGLGRDRRRLRDLWQRTAYPGVAATLPVAGAALIIAAGCGAAARFGPERLLSIWPMRWTGKISYSLYLWHWPLLILMPDALGHPLTLAERLLAIAVAVGLSVLTYVFIEQPFQHQQVFVARPRRAFALGSALIGSSLVVALILPGMLTIPGGTHHELAAAVTPIASGNPVASPADGTGGADATNQPSSSQGPGTAVVPLPSPATDAQIAAAVALAATQHALPTDLSPDLTKASHDFPNTKGCEVVAPVLTPKLPCDDFGAPSGTKDVVLIGDSHAGMWLDGVSAVARANNWKLTVYTKTDCPIGNYQDLVDPVLKRTYTECNTWRTNMIAAIGATHPALVIIGSLARPIAAREPAGLKTSIQQIEEPEPRSPSWPTSPCRARSAVFPTACRCIRQRSKTARSRARLPH